MIYICIPTHNEQQTVGVVLWKLRQVLTDFPREYQILVADDASSDKTADVLEPYTRVLPLTVIRSETRQGTAASLEMLLREAVRRSEYPKRDAIVTLQADFSDEPDDVVPLIKRLEAGADVAIGNKISPAKETRSRRYSRMLARFFMRRQKWPEAVATPFDGYRAYRLYSVKRAIELQPGRRIVRYDSWAGNAELLRAVLPHARRVDVVDVDDRSDRLQRPRREKPLASAMQVRSLAGGAEPPGLVGVQDLDRIAQTASRSRERAAVTARSLQAARAEGARSNGSRTRDRRPAADARQGGRARATGGGSRARSAQSDEDRPQRSRSRTQSGGRAVDLTAESDAPTESRSRKTRRPEGEGRRRKPRAEQGAAAETAAAEAPAQGADGAVAPEGAAKPKRKRRRRRKGGQGTGTDAGSGQLPTGDATAGSGQAPTGDATGEGTGGAEAAGSAPAPSTRESTGGAPAAEDDAAPSTGEKKRRRRGGRRGGRGRRRPRAAGAGEAVAGEAVAGEAVAGEAVAGGGAADAAPGAPVEQTAAQPAARMEND